jgi:hypothetical protein
MNNSCKLGLFASLLAAAASAFEHPLQAEPQHFMKRPMGRSRVPGPRRPAGSKMWRQAQKHRLGMATLR